MEPNAKEILAAIQSGEMSKEKLGSLSSQIREAIRNDPAKGKEFGHLMSVVSNAIRQKEQTADINWVRVGNGSLAIGHKPGGKISYEGLRNEGATIILTLLQGSEGALQIGDKVKKAGMLWVWFPFSAAMEDLISDTSKVEDLLQRLKEKLDTGSKIYVHCSAGIHRTGMIAYALLRHMEFSKADALDMLRKLREVTAMQVGDERIAWGDQFGN